MKSKPAFTKAEAEEIVDLIKEKLKADSTKQKGIRAKIRKRGFYASDYDFHNGYTVEQFLSVAKIAVANTSVPQMPSSKAVVEPKSTSKTTSKSRSKSDESYVIDLCDEVLKQKSYSPASV